jgi:hypothetical protein
MVPFADQFNHENVDVGYDCLDSKTGESLLSKDELEEKRRKEVEQKRKKEQEFLKDLRQDLESMKKKLYDREGKEIKEEEVWEIQTRPVSDKLYLEDRENIRDNEKGEMREIEKKTEELKKRLEAEKID